LESLRALRLNAGGEERWRFTYPDTGRPGVPALVVFSPHEPPNVLVPVVTSANGAAPFTARVHEVTWSGGLIRTREFPVTGDHHRQLSFLTVGGGVRFLLAGTSVYAYLAGSSSVWNIVDPDAHAITSAPALASSFLFFTNSRRLHVVRTADGSLAWSDNTPTDGISADGLYGGVAIDQGRVAVTDDQRLRVFRSAP
jgi:outer membrane protein assembly factor BamB